MRWASVIALSLGIVVVLTVVGMRVYRERIERDLAARAAQALGQREITVADVRFQGRDGAFVVEKSVGLSSADVKKTVESVFGVRNAHVDEIVKVDPTLIAERIGEVLRLGGKVAEQSEIEALVARAAEVFGSSHVENVMEHAEVVRKSMYLIPVAGLFSIVQRVGPEAKLELVGRNLLLFGLVPDADTKAAIEKQASEHVPAGLHLESRLVVPERTTTAFKLPDLAELLDAIRLRFEFDSTRLTQETKGNLELLKQTLSEFKIERMRIFGHADAIGTEAYNMELSRRRAVSIRQNLESSGFRSRKFEIEPRGESDPVADNSTPEGRQLNRRVAFGIVGDK